MSDIYTRGFVKLRDWQGSQSSIRWATEEEVRAEFGMSRNQWYRRWIEGASWGKGKELEATPQGRRKAS